MKNSKGIFIRQNEPEMLAIQKTADCCYLSGKRIVFALAIVSIVVPIIINILVAIFPSKIMANVLTVIAVICFFVADYIRTRISNCKKNGAKLQQYYDEYVFGLECHKIKETKKIDRETRLRLINKYASKDDQKFKKWYSDYSELSYEKAIYYCQRENVRWDGNLRKKYFISLVVTIALLSALFVVNACLRNESINSLITIIVTFAPILSYLWNGGKKIFRDLKTQQELWEETQEIEKTINNPQDALAALEDLQIGIFNYRQTAYLIPDWFYRIFKKSMQKEEDQLAKSLSNELKREEKRNGNK